MSSSRGGKLIRQYRFLEPDAVARMNTARIGSEPNLAFDGDETSVLSNSAEANLVEDARSEAARLLAEARREAEEIAAGMREDARREGFEAGRQEGMALAEAETREEIAHLQEILQGVVAQRAQLLAGAEEGLVDLALAIARKVIGDAASRDIGVVAAMANQAIAVMGQPGSVRVRLNPKDAARMEEYWESGNGGLDWEIEPDERVGAGGCIVISGSSEVDARPDTQLDLIQQSFTRAKEGRS